MPFSSSCKDLSDISWYLSNYILSCTVHLPSACKTALANIEESLTYPTVTLYTELTPSNTDVELCWIVQPPVAHFFSVAKLPKKLPKLGKEIKKGRQSIRAIVPEDARAFSSSEDSIFVPWAHYNKSAVKETYRLSITVFHRREVILLT